VWFKYPTRDIPIFAGLNLTVRRLNPLGLHRENADQDRLRKESLQHWSALPAVERPVLFPYLRGKPSSSMFTYECITHSCRFYDVQKGKILYNGTNISELDMREYRKSISLVAQEPTLFQGTIRDNVLLGVDEGTTTEALHQACRDAEIHDFITSLPEAYNTDVGSKGIALSGGQKQRIAIARALIRSPKILLLDEATSSLDSESEKLVQAAFERAGKGRTMVVVAHRLATVQNADVIFVLGEGRVLEKGDHHSLLRQRGVYYQMCQSQALDR
jgi:ATP-binding cassette subfamily B (MDR/TAP) protein 1